jgi:hypothetical protein
MITFYKHNTTECLVCYETEMALKDMVVAHTIKPLEGHKRQAPLIVEGKKKFTGHQAIKKYISDLRKTMGLWRKFQSDSCYTDTDGKVC